jgi:NAD(P)-dependent dehydrogenase (short-subunit alcohol dehydrogenase family)
MRLKDKVAIVTGASSGIGLEIAKRYIEEGAKVVLSDVNVQAGEAVASQLGENALFLPCDVLMVSEVDMLVSKTIEHFGHLDIMVNNAGIGSLGGALECENEVWDKTIAINLSGVFYGLRAAARAMKEAGTKGSIINMSSILGTVGMPGAISYCAAKGGVTNMTRAAAQDLASCSIRVNAIAPAFIETAMTKGVLDDENFKAFVTGNTPLGYVGKPEDIANAAVYLAEDSSGYVTGTIQHVDGGWTCK